VERGNFLGIERKVVMFRRWAGPMLLAIALALASLLAIACGGGGGGGSAEARQEVEDTVRTLAGYGAEDVDAFLAGVTDNVLENFFGFTREDCRENAQDCVGEPSETASFANTKVSGDTATTEGTFTFGGEEGGEQTFLLSLVREDGVWKLDELRSPPQEIPEGVKKIDLELNEFAFGFRAADITDGNFAFAAKNVGEQNHQVVISKVPADLDIQELLQSEFEEEVEGGVQDIAFTLPFSPGEEQNVVFDQPLEPGRYAMFCFVPDKDDPERTPHALKGMTAEFTIE